MLSQIRITYDKLNFPFETIDGIFKYLYNREFHVINDKYGTYGDGYITLNINVSEEELIILKLKFPFIV